MTKKAKIQELKRKGKTLKEIVRLTGASYGTVCNVVWEMNHPGAIKIVRDRFLKTLKGREFRRKHRAAWKKRKAVLHKKLVDQVEENWQLATKEVAINHKKKWYKEQVLYIIEQSKNMTAREIAFDLGRTYLAVQKAASKFGISLQK